MASGGQSPGDSSNRWGPRDPVCGRWAGRVGGALVSGRGAGLRPREGPPCLQADPPGPCPRRRSSVRLLRRSSLGTAPPRDLAGTLASRVAGHRVEVHPSVLPKAGLAAGGECAPCYVLLRSLRPTLFPPRAGSPEPVLRVGSRGARLLPGLRTRGWGGQGSGRSVP